MISAASKMLGFILRNCKDFSHTSTFLQLFYSLVRSRLEYGAMIWYPVYQVNKDRIEAVQRRFLKYICFKEDGNYPLRNVDHLLLLNRFHVIALELRRIYLAVAFLYKLIHYNIDCECLLANIQFLIPRLESRQHLTFYMMVVQELIFYLEHR